MATESIPNSAPPAADPAATPAPPAADPAATPPGDPPPAAAAGEDPPATPPADPPADPPAEPSAKSAAAAKGHETRAAKAARRAELSEDPDVQKIVEQARARAKTEAMEAAAEAAKRESMTEVDRAKAEAADAKAELAESKAQLGQQKLEREYSEALVESELKILPNSRKIMRRLVAEAMTADATITAAEALTMVAGEYDNLLQPSAAGSVQPAPQSQRSGATTTPTPKRETAAPATQEPEKGPDVMKMTKQEFRDYRSKRYGVQLTN